jgi:hypothetical protein
MSGFIAAFGIGCSWPRLRKSEPAPRLRVDYPSMRLRSAIALLTLGASPAASPLAAQGWAVDEGTFVVVKAGAPGFTESFKIKRNATGLITATGLQTLGTQLTSSSLTTDSLGAPVQYELQVKKQGALVVKVRGMSAASRRFTAYSSASGEESVREYPLLTGRTLILEPGLLHQLFFLPLAGHDGRVNVLQPGAAHAAVVVLTSKGLDNITVGRRAVTANRYSVTGLSADCDFWTDAQGRLLRVDIPSQGLSATREELPR